MVLKIVITHSVRHTPSLKNSKDLLVTYFDRVLLNRTETLLEEGIINRRKEVDSICLK